MILRKVLTDLNLLIILTQRRYTGNFGFGGLVASAVIGVVETNADEPVNPMMSPITYRVSGYIYIYTTCLV